MEREKNGRVSIIIIFRVHRPKDEHEMRLHLYNPFCVRYCCISVSERISYDDDDDVCFMGGFFFFLYTRRPRNRTPLENCTRPGEFCIALWSVHLPRSDFDSKHIYPVTVSVGFVFFFLFFLL